jgi:hypothetical protein
MKYKQTASKSARGINIASKAVLPATGVGIAITKKVQKAQAKKEAAKQPAQPDYMSLPKSPDMIQKSGSGSAKLVAGAQKMALKAGMKMAERKAEQKLDKKFGKSRGYRIGKAVFKGALAASTGNYAGAVNQGANIYYEADPNKKRAARVREGVQGATAIYSSLRTGNVTGAIRGASAVYSAVDDNRNRVSQFQAFNQNYLSPTLDLADSITGFASKSSKASANIEKSGITNK